MLDINTIEKSEEIFAGQLGVLEALQEVLGRSHDDRADVVATLSRRAWRSPR